MNKFARIRKYLSMREPVNAWTHFLTFLAAIVGLVLLIILTAGNVAKLITMTIYGSSVIILFGASSVYHWAQVRPRVVLILKKIDHIAIYFLIAGSATPVFYHGLTGIWQWIMLGGIWGLAIIGALLKVWFINLPRYISTAFYLSLGWIAIIPIAQLVANLPLGAIMLMVLGGVFYSIGAIIYATRCFNFFPNHFGFHEIFHLFVTAGTISHFSMVLFYLVPL
ncbi:MAG: PAQR family membrane homeostasis protein TrhA [bacterium]|jgi:hemolysin III